MLTVVTGPPCSGKSTEVRKRAKPGDIVIDYDLIAQALGSPDSHDHNAAIMQVAIVARRAAIGAAVEAAKRGHDVWVIDGKPERRLNLYRAAGAQFVPLSAARAELHRRADAAGRPTRWHQLIDEWDVQGRSGYTQPKRAGRPYRRERDRVVANGEACVICGYPVDRSLPGRSSWGPSLHHPDPLRRGGRMLGQGQLAHTGCNAGVRDAIPGSRQYAERVQARRAAYLRHHAGWRVTQRDGQLFDRASAPKQASVPTSSRDW